MNKIFRYRQMLQLVSANFKELIREPGVLFWGIGFPILMSLGLGLAFTGKKDANYKVAYVQDTAYSNDSTTVLNSFLLSKTKTETIPGDGLRSVSFEIQNAKTGNTTFIFYQKNWNDAILAMKRGLISIILEDKKDHIRYHFDPANPDAKLCYMQLNRIIANKGVLDENPAYIEPLSLSGTRYIDFLIPGLIAMGVMMACMWGLSYTIIERRSKKLLRRMVATPMKKSHFLISMISVRFAMSFIESLLLFIFSVFAFGISIQGNIAALLLIFIAGNIAFAGIAVFASSYTSKTEIGNGLINVVVMPMMILSGIFFSYHNFPDWSIAVISKLPLTMLADGIRSVFIEGAGFRDILLPSGILTAIGILFFTTALKIFRWH